MSIPSLTFRALAVVLAFAALQAPRLAAATTSSISQHGITWTFSQPVTYGQFVNGDYWVVGPVTVASVSPAPSVAPPDEVNNLGTNQWGDTGLQSNTTRRNGSMVVMTPGASQGYDSRGVTYDAATSISFPYTLAVNRSLISSKSRLTIPSQQMHHAIMWTSEKNGNQVMQTAAILTCLPSAPPADAFRPTYIGGSKPIFTLSQVRWDRLMSLPAGTGMPAWSQWERYLERPWIDHLNGTWQQQWLLPIENMPAYGREYPRILGIAGLMLHSDASQAQKRTLLIRLLQIGIDWRGVVQAGGYWNEGGGVTNGRKFPIVFAARLIDDPYFSAEMPASAVIHEDTQTYYGSGWAGMKALWQMVMHHGPRLPYMHLHPSQYSSYDGGWAATSEDYRKCCTVKAWPAQALAILLAGGKAAWNHDAFFDNVDDWMRYEDRYAAGRGGLARPGEETTVFDSFARTMWDLHLNSVPAQPGGTLFRMWNASTSQWEPNAPPGGMPVSTPVFNPLGGNFTSAQNITIATSTSGASIRFTTDGSTPSPTTGTLYAGPVPLGATTTLKAIAYKSGIPDSSVSTANFTFYPPGTVVATAGSSFQSTAFVSQTGGFSATFTATPSASPTDGVVGLSAAAAATYADLVVIVRFNNAGLIDARNGGVYQAAASIPYSANTSYTFRLVVNLASHTYSAHVTPAGGAEQTIGLNYAFRTEQSGVASLNTWNANVDAAAFGNSLVVSNFSAGTTTASPTAPTGLKVKPGP
jgi:hypothetical protein